jgi:class 3 adenylate cyclase
MPRLDPKERAGLPDRAFAYVDSRGERRLPIHDAAHVRNALVRFGQVTFEDERARERARMRLLNAAKKFKIVPVGFIAGQLQTERALGQQPNPPVQLPSGFVTMLMTDIEGSTALVQHLGERYRELIDEVWAILRSCVVDAGGHEVEARADEFFAVFEAPRSAVDAAVAVQRELLDRSIGRGAKSYQGGARLERLSLQTGEDVPLVDGPVGVSALGVAGRQVVYALIGVPDPNELYTLDVGKTLSRQLTHLNTSWLANKDLSLPEQRWITRPDGTRVQYWVMKPLHAESGKSALTFATATSSVTGRCSRRSLPRSPSSSPAS